MAEALRAALRLFPAVKSVPGSSSACTRASLVRRSNGRVSEQQQQQSVLFPFPSHLRQQEATSISLAKDAAQPVTGFARLARAVLAYVGAGISAVAANQLAGPCSVHGKDLPRIEAADNYTMAAAEGRAAWQRTNRHLIQEDSVRAPKLSHCPSLSKGQAEFCHPSTGRAVENIPSFYSTNSWGSSDSKIDTQWQQLSSSAQHYDYHSEYFGLDEVLGSRFKSAGLQALAVECSNVKGGTAGYMGVAPEYASGAELELEWQLLVDPKFKSGHPPAFQAAETIRSVTEEPMIDSVDEDKAARDETEEVNVIRGEIMAKSLKESGEIFSSTDAKNPQTMCFGVQQDQIMEKTIEKCMSMEEKCVLKLEETVVASPGDAFAKSSPVKAGVSWRTANKEALAALVAQKGAERVQNCDLPTPQSKPVLKTPLESCDVMDETALGISGSMDQSLMAAILQAGEPTLLESLKLPASPFASTKLSPKPSTCHFPKSSQPLAIPALPNTFSPRRGSRSVSSADNRNTSWSGGGGGSISGSPGKGSGLLGEALCHSQTRAREAEKKADQTLQEYKKLSKLFFQEASLSLTYRQWVTSLQAENTRLKMYLKNQQAAAWLQCRFFSPFAALERLSSNHWKFIGKKQARHQMHRHFSAIQPDKDPPPGDVAASYRQTGAGIIVGCTLGFAFALGLSLASAGLVLGWSMGWIVLAC